MSIDELLSSEELFCVAEKDSQNKIQHIRDLIFGLLDCVLILFLFLPFFGERNGDFIHMVSLISLRKVPWLMKAIYLTVVLLTIIWGIAILALQNYPNIIWIKSKNAISTFLSILGVIIFMATLEPYAAFFTFVFLIIKGILLIKR